MNFERATQSGGRAIAASLIAVTALAGCGGEGSGATVDGYVISKQDMGGSTATPATMTTLTLQHCAEYKPKALDCSTQQVTIARTTANMYHPGSFYPNFTVPTRQPVSHPSATHTA